jgi:hypothetical protein
MLKKFVVLVFMLFFLALTSFTEAKTTLTILYTGSVRGTIAPVSLPT